MPMTTRDAVDAMLPPGTTVEDLNDRELGDLFEAVVAQTEDEESPPSTARPPAE
jgi:hypothetical protein